MNGSREMTRAGRASSSLSNSNNSTPVPSREYTLKFTPFLAGVAPNGELRPGVGSAGMPRLASLIGRVAINCLVPFLDLAVYFSPHCGIGHGATFQISEA